jgi:hypothetical protein
MSRNSKAIVQIPKLGGHGVLVGDVILTAAHCVEFTTSGAMTLGSGWEFMHEIKTHEGRLKGAVIFVEPVSDIAVLSCLDDQSLPDEAEKFEEFCANSEAMALATKQIIPNEPFAVRIHNYDGTWVKGTAKIFRKGAHKLCIGTDQEIKGGASGGPVLNSAGELVGIVSHCPRQKKGPYYFLCPRPLECLPTWIQREHLSVKRR